MPSLPRQPLSCFLSCMGPALSPLHCAHNSVLAVSDAASLPCDLCFLVEAQALLLLLLLVVRFLLLV